MFSSNQRKVQQYGPDPKKFGALYIKPEIDDISVLYFIGLSLEFEMPFFPCCMRTAGGNKIIIGNDLCPYKTSLDIRMYPACRLLRIHALFYGPGPDLVFTGGQKRYQPEQVIRNTDKLIKRRFINAEVVKKNLRLRREKAGLFPSRSFRTCSTPSPAAL